MHAYQSSMSGKVLSRALLVVIIACWAGGAPADDEDPVMSDDARPVEHDPDVFRPDPDYEDKPYDAEDQLAIYGGKRAIPPPRPMLEWGRPIYGSGPLRGEDRPPSERLDPVINQFTVYGDVRTAYAHADVEQAGDLGQFAMRANIDLDWKITGTERIHAFIRPFEDGTTFTRCQATGSLDTGECKAEFDADLDALFFEGDLGAMVSASRGSYTGWDLPFAVGLMPLLFQNGVWLEDAFTGVAFTRAARNSPGLDISNYDLTFFAGFDKVDSGALGGIDDARIYGATAFIDANQGYWEVGYAFTDASSVDSDLSYSNVTVAFTRRYRDRLSNSVRLIYNFGQDVPQGLRTADGFLLLVENSLVTRMPTTLVPYVNLFYGKDSPQSVARAADAGGVLKNTGITFESDGMTGFPTLDASARNTYGGALGVQYLFGLDRQIVVEIAGVKPHGERALAAVQSRQIGAGVRYQRPLTLAWLMRVDAVWGDAGSAQDFSGARIEFRRKF